MSGEAVVLVGVSVGTAGLVAAAGVAAFVAADMVAEWMREQHAIAQRNMRWEKEASAAWRDFHRSEQREIEKLALRHQAVRRSLEALRLTASEAPVGAEDRAENQGFVPEGRADMSAMLRSVLRRIPPELGAAAAAPLQRLQRQARELDQRLISPSPLLQETLQSFRVTVQRTVEQVLENLERESAARRRLLERVEAMLGEAIAYRNLARERASGKELSQLQEHLFRLLTAGEAAAAGVELLEGQLQRLKAQVDAELEQDAIQAVLRGRVRRHLADLGYRLCAVAGEPDMWEIPGGERVRVALQPGNRLAFQLVHERPVASDRPLSGQELAFLREQERRWCGDLHGLLRKLQEDGFEFQVQLERETPEEAIPVVVVEDVDDWIEEERSHEAPRRRHLP